MSLYEITRSCGHAEQVQIYGTNAHGEHAQRAQREAQMPCAACRRQAHCATSAVHARHAATLGLPALTGTDRAVAWAETLRAQGLRELEELRAEVTTWVADHPEDEADAAALDRALHVAVRRHTDAAWWIDNRTTLRRALHRDAQNNLNPERDLA